MFLDKATNPHSNENLNTLCRRCCEFLTDKLTSEIPASGKTKGYQVHFTNIIKEWSIASCGMRIVQSFKGDNIRAVEIYATFPDGSGYEMKNILFHGTNEEIKDYLSNKNFITEMIDIYNNFSESIADKI